MKTLSNLSLAKRLTLGFGLLVVFLLTMGGTTLWRIAAVDSDTQEVTANLMPKQRRLVDIEVNINEIARAMRNMLIMEKESDLQAQRAEIDSRRAAIQQHVLWLDERVTHLDAKNLLGKVHSLAQRSAEAAKEIKGLISASVDRVEQGTALVDKAGTTMQEVVSSIRRVTDIVGEISSASQEQNAGVGQVAEAVSQMDQATQQNVALVEESAAAASSLRSQAAQQVQAVSVFQLAGGGGSMARLADKSLGDAIALPSRPESHATKPRTGAVKRPASLPSPKRPAPVRTNPVGQQPASQPQVFAKAGDEGDWESF